MANFYAVYSSSGGSSGSNASVGPNGSAIPTSSTLVAGENPSGNQQPLQTDAAGALIVTGESSGTPINVNVADYGGVATSLGQKTSAASQPVVIASDQSAVPVSGTVTANQGSAGASAWPVSTTSASTITVVQPSGSNLHVDVDSSALPTGAATSALQSNVQSAPGTSATTAITVQGSASGVAVPISGTVTVTPSGTQNVNVTQIAGSSVSTAATGVQKVGIVGSTGSALDSAAGTPNSEAITIQGNASGVAVPVSSSTLATAANQTNASQKTQIVDGSGTVVGPDQTISGTNYFPVVQASSATPGSAVAARSTQIAGSDGTNARTVSTDTSGNVNVNVVSSAVVSGNTPLQFVRNVYSTTNVTTSAYVQLIASTSGVTNVIETFDSSGQTLEIAFGASGSEVNQFLIFPGGNGRNTCKIPSGTRVSIRAVSANATSGEFDLNLYT